MKEKTEVQIPVTQRATAREMLAQKDLAYAKKGLFIALMSGMLWGLDGVLLGLALAMAPFNTSAASYTGPLVGAADFRRGDDPRRR